MQRLKPAKPIFRVSQFPGKLRNIPFNRESRLLGVRNGVKKKEGERERKKKVLYGSLLFLLFLPFSPSLPLSYLPRYENINPQIRRRTFNNRLCKSKDYAED